MMSDESSLLSRCASRAFLRLAHRGLNPGRIDTAMQVTITVNGEPACVVRGVYELGGTLFQVVTEWQGEWER